MTVIKRKFPRVGDEYQIEIPSLLSRSKYISENKNKFIEKAVESELASEDFSDKIQNESLLLGLCIFWDERKDFTQIRKFLGCEPSLDVISFYYRNEFFKSDERRIWVDCKKAQKSELVVLGKMIFKGCRLEELLSRLSVHMSKEDAKSITKASKLFKNGKMRLLEFVSTLKDKTGMDKFVEAMAIGKGERDVTRMIEEEEEEPPAPAQKKKKKKEKKLINLPAGITCLSSLSPAKIIGLLKGSNLNKSKDFWDSLFWEAVWPLLVARGWELKGPSSCYAKIQSSFFLVPGVAKLPGRRGSVKGMHYFDSIRDVLKKVLSDPTLLLLLEADQEEEEEPQTECEKHDDSKKTIQILENSQINYSSHTDSDQNRIVSDLVRGEPHQEAGSEPVKKRQKILLEEEQPAPRLLFDLNYPPPLPPGFDPYEF